MSGAGGAGDSERGRGRDGDRRPVAQGQPSTASPELAAAAGAAPLPRGVRSRALPCCPVPARPAGLCAQHHQQSWFCLCFSSCLVTRHRGATVEPVLMEAADLTETGWNDEQLQSRPGKLRPPGQPGFK